MPNKKEDKKEIVINSNNPDELLTAFQNAQEKNEIVEVLKELFDTKKLNLITDLSPDHIALITRMLVISDLKNIPEWKQGIEIFMQLRVSKNRQSRTELIKAIGSLLHQRQQRGLLGIGGNRDNPLL